jgi:hypothetical protein
MVTAAIILVVVTATSVAPDVVLLDALGAVPHDPLVSNLIGGGDLIAFWDSSSQSYHGIIIKYHQIITPFGELLCKVITLGSMSQSVRKWYRQNTQ